jgi:hypothetical protein
MISFLIKYIDKLASMPDGLLSALDDEENAIIDE